METNKDYQNRLPEHPEPLELGAHEEASNPTPLMGETHNVANRHITHKGSYLGWAWMTVLALAVLIGSVYWFSDRPGKADKDMYAARTTGLNTDKTALSSAPIADAEIEIAEVDVSDVKANAAATVNTKSDAIASAAPQDVVYLFPLDGSDIPDDATLNKLAKDVAASGAYVSIVAYTDESGNADYNQRLSERRAKKVGDYLIAHGVPSDHVKTKGMGETHAYPTAAQDRRAEIHVGA